MGASYFKDTPFVGNLIQYCQYVSRAFVALPFGAEKNPDIIISVTYRFLSVQIDPLLSNFSIRYRHIDITYAKINSLWFTVLEVHESVIFPAHEKQIRP